MKTQEKYYRNSYLNFLFSSKLLSDVCLVNNLLTASTYRLHFSLAKFILSLPDVFTEEQFSENLSVNHPDEDASALLSVFMELKILFTDVTKEELKNRVTWVDRIKEDWCKNGWIEASDYFIFSYDYGFNDKDKIGSKVAMDFMNIYSAQEPDNNRYKSYPPTNNSLNIPKPKQVTEITSSSQYNKLLKITSLAFLKTKQIKPYWNGKPLILKTSPTGGARNSTEGYIISLTDTILSKGIYHINSVDNRIDMILSKDDSVVASVFKSLINRAKFDVDTIFIVTTTFERNMYRYREPRTFRTIHMDAGHMCANVEMLCRCEGVKHFVEYIPNTEEVNALLEIDSLNESALISIGAKFTAC